LLIGDLIKAITPKKERGALLITVGGEECLLLHSCSLTYDKFEGKIQPLIYAPEAILFCRQ
jgi:hypothetical protein